MNRRIDRDERGATLVIIAISITLLFLIMAIVIDLSFTRADRRGGQLGVDNAAATAAQTLAFTDATTACQDALGILSATLDETFSPTQCASEFSGLCNDATPGSLAVLSGDYTVNIHHPVLNDSPLMTNTSTIGNAGIASSADDSLPCERIGVEITTDGSAVFGGIAGQSERSSTVHAVGAIDSGNDEVRPLNLLVLERRDCQSFNISGQGTVVVAPSIDSNTRAFVAGIAAADSDGTTACGGNKAVLEASGLGVLRANGPCPTNTSTVCQGEGRIPLLPSFTNGSCAGTGDKPACTEGANAEITPDIEVLPGRFTRAPLDHRFNCKASYSSEPWYSGALSQPIPGCTSQTSNTDYVDELKAFAGAMEAFVNTNGTTPAGWNHLTGNQDCKPTGQVFTGNYYVDCDTFDPAGITSFVDGNVIFRDKVRLTSGTLNLHSCNPACANTISWSAGDNFDENQSSSDAGWIYIGDELSVSTDLNVNKATIFFGPSGSLKITGGNVNWDAPDSEGPFDDLAMWSEGTDEHSLGGNGLFDLVGTFFNGRSTFKYAGATSQTLDEAQFIANKLTFDGQGTITLSPSPDRNVDFPIEPKFGLIR